MSYDWIKDYMPIITVIVSSIIVVVGWIIVHRLTGQRNIDNDRRQITLHRLIEAYEFLMYEVNLKKPSPDSEKKLEKSMAILQLFGSSTLIKRVNIIEQQCKKAGSINFEIIPLLEELRDALRKELNLEPAPTPVIYFKIIEK